MLSRMVWSGLIAILIVISLATLWMDGIALERVILIADVAILFAIAWGIHREEKHHDEEMALFQEELRLMKEENDK